MNRLCALILTFNEEKNIARTLNQLSWIDTIFVLDSFSTDETETIASSFSNVEVHKRKFDTHTQQWEFGRKLTYSFDWVLALDADYFIPEESAHEILDLIEVQDSEKVGYYASFNYAINGKVIRSGIYPPVCVLFKPTKATYVKDGHTQRLAPEGETGWISTPFIHDDRKPFKRWIHAQVGYARLEAQKLSSSNKIGLKDQLRVRFKGTPLLVFFYCLILKAGIFDGKEGWMYAYQRLIAEIFLQYHLLTND